MRLRRVARTELGKTAWRILRRAVFFGAAFVAGMRRVRCVFMPFRCRACSVLVPRLCRVSTALVKHNRRPFTPRSVVHFLSRITSAHLRVLADISAEPLPTPRKTFERGNMSFANTRFRVPIHNPRPEADRDKIVADFISLDARVAAEIPIALHSRIPPPRRLTPHTAVFIPLTSPRAVRRAARVL